MLMQDHVIPALPGLASRAGIIDATCIDPEHHKLTQSANTPCFGFIPAFENRGVESGKKIAAIFAEVLHVNFDAIFFALVIDQDDGAISFTGCAPRCAKTASHP
jgi:hypothetical protein